MVHNHDTAKTTLETRAAGRRGCAGFTLIELIVAVAIIGIISAWAITNWSGFVRHQELRQEAHGLHTEIMALRARAMGEREEVQITFLTGPNRYEIRFRDASVTPLPAWPPTANRTANLTGNVTVATTTLGSDLPAELTGLGTNNWNSEIVIKPHNLNAFDPGWIIIGNGGNRTFAIARGANSVNPEIFQRSGTGAWTRTRK